MAKAPSPWLRYPLYAFFRYLFRVIGVAFFRHRCLRREWEPREGGVLVCSNHQSYLDPALVGMSIHRHARYLARETLFRGPFGWLIRAINAIPLDREGAGLRGLKETLQCLKQGEVVVIFPEGTRSPDGQIAPLKPGFAALARRSGAAVMPAAVDGAFQAWPRKSPLPHPETIRVYFGPPLSPEEIAALSDKQLIAEIERRIRLCHAQARAARHAADSRSE